MPNRFVQSGERIDFTPGSAVAAGALVVFGARVFFAPRAIAANELGALQTYGVIEYAKATGQEWTVGARLFFDATNNRLTTTASGNTAAGYAAAAAAAGAVEGLCLLGQ